MKHYTMKVLLIQSYLGRKEGSGAIFPLGLCYIATALNDYNVELLDMNVHDSPYQAVKEKLSAFSPHVVGLSIRNIDTTQWRDIFYYFKTIQPTVCLIKEVVPNAKLVVGGPGYSMFAKEIMERVPEIDFGIYLEGEESVAELLQNLDKPESVRGIFFRKDGAVCFSGKRQLPDFVKLPIPRRDLTEIKQYYGPGNNIGIQTKRGCLLNCAYCSYPFLNGRRVRLRFPEQVVDEIEYLVREFNIRKFLFVDSIFNVPIHHAREICHEIIKRKLSIEWGAWYNLKEVSEEDILLAREAGCREFGFSPDAINNKVLALLGKNIRERDIYKSLNLMRRIKGIKAGYNFFYVSPGQTISGCLKLLLLYFLIPVYLKGRGGVILSWIRVEPETRLYAMALRERRISKDVALLPKDEKDLKQLFYHIDSLRLMNGIARMILNFTEKILRPMAKVVVGVFRGSNV